MAAEGKKESSLFRPPIRFDLFELNAVSGQLRRSGLPVDVPPQALRVLVMLAERPDDLVTRKEIKEALWPGQAYGDFDSRLNFAIKKLREALGDDAEQPRYIQTVRNAGYRFIASVQGLEPRNSGLEVDTLAIGDKTSPHSGTPQTGLGGERARFWGQTFRTIAVSVLLAVAVNLALFALWVRREHEQTLHLYAPVVDQTTGTVVIRGVDTAHPKTPFRFEWGDGTTSIGWFPQTKIYPKVSHSYKVRVVATYQDGSHADANIAVDLAFGANGRTTPSSDAPDREAVLAVRQRGPSRPAVSEVQASAAGTKAESAPEIVSVSPILPRPRQRVVIKGRGFGLHVPYVHTDSPYLAIRDLTGDWAAGRMIPQNSDEVMLDVESWTDAEIVLSGFSGDYGLKGWKLNSGDNLEIAVWNPQSGVGPALYPVTVISANGPR